MNPKCEAVGCTKRPSFGFLGGRPLRCKSHLLEGMVRCAPHPVHRAAFTQPVIRRPYMCMVEEYWRV